MKTIKNYRFIPAASFLMIIFLLSPSAIRAQGKTDFSGKWTLNESKSELGDGNYRGGASRMTIQQQGNNLTIERVSQNRNGDEITTTEKITLDGKESDNSTDNRTRKSKAMWSADGKMLTINTHMEFDRNGDTMSFDVVEIWKMQDSKTMVIDYTSTSSRGERKRSFVYEKS